MKKLYRISLFVLSLLIVSCGGSPYSDSNYSNSSTDSESTHYSLDFRLVNNTSVNLYGLSLADCNDGTVYNIDISDGSLSAGSSLNITFDEVATPGTRFAVVAADMYGNTVSFEGNFDLTHVTSIVLTENEYGYYASANDTRE